jgi:polysaccharide export outer membrane protein
MGPGLISELPGAENHSPPPSSPPDSVEADVFRMGGVGLRVSDQPKPPTHLDRSPGSEGSEKAKPAQLGELRSPDETAQQEEAQTKPSPQVSSDVPAKSEEAVGEEGFLTKARNMLESALLARPMPRRLRGENGKDSPAPALSLAPSADNTSSPTKPETSLPPSPPDTAPVRDRLIPPMVSPIPSASPKRSSETPRPPMTSGDGYVIQPGDVLSIKVMNEDNLAMGARVGKEGTINFPYVDELQVRGMTVEQVSRLLQEKLSAFFVNPVVIVQIAEFSARQFSILGQIASPGVYSIPSFQGSLDLVEALAMAGGPGSPGLGRFSDIGTITIKRFVNGKEVVIPVDGKAIGRNQAGTSIRILPGDSIFVQLMDKQFTVMGQVKSPGRFEIPAMRDYVTVLDAIAMAGGPTRLGDMGRVVIKRMEGDKEQRYSVNAKEMGVVENSPQFRIRPGDTVTIRERIF